MQAAPAVTVSVGRDPATQAALAALGTLAVASCAVWAVQRADLLGASAFVMTAGCVAVAIVAWAREPTRQLRWDGQRWWLRAGSGPDEAVAGEVAVALDLDAWLLLRFRGDPTSGVPTATWLALRRALHRADWHALRCAVFSPRTAEVTAA